jgi:hypothetical protein
MFSISNLKNDSRSEAQARDHHKQKEILEHVYRQFNHLIPTFGREIESDVQTLPQTKQAKVTVIQE